MQRLKYSDLLTRLQSFDLWLKSLGITPKLNDRIHLAFETLRKANDAVLVGRATGNYEKVSGQDIHPIVEALEAYDILCAFEGDNSSELSQAIQRALSGPFQPRDESPSNSEGRNTWFELSLAADWRLHGAALRLGEPDLRLERDDYEFWLACKRPQYEHSVRANIRSAISQLENNLQTAPNKVYGVVAISLNRVLNPGSGYWPEDIERLGDLVHNEMIHQSRHWKAADADPRICAILFHITAPSDLGRDVDLCRVSYTAAGPVHCISEGTREFERFVMQMKTAME